MTRDRSIPGLHAEPNLQDLMSTAVIIAELPHTIDPRPATVIVPILHLPGEVQVQR